MSSLPPENVTVRARHDRERLVQIEQDEDGMFVALVPSLPECVSQGTTRSEAQANVQEAIGWYLESLSAHDELVPPPIDTENVEGAV